MNFLSSPRPDLRRSRAFSAAKKILRVCCCLWCCTGLCALALPLEANAVSSFSLSGSYETRGDEPWHLEADNMVSYDDGVVVEATGDVVLTRGTDYLKADFARYYTATDWIFVKGAVKVKLGRDELQAAEAEFDLDSKTGWLKNGSVFMAGPHITFTGEEVVKHWGDRYTFNEAKVTACEGPTPAWSLAAGEATVELDGYATLSHVKFNVLDQGVLWAPWMALPAKTTRQTGLLTPDYGTSDMHGTFVSVPWFWAIDKSHDLTVTGSWFSKNGFMPSVEYRSRTSDTEKTWLTVDYLHDDHLGKWDKIIPENRFWLRGMGEGMLAHTGWKYKFDVDYASDGRFLSDYDDYMSGYDNSHDDLLELFGRDLAPQDKHRVTAGYVYKDWDRFGVTAGLRYEQNPWLRHDNMKHVKDTQVQKLPEFTAYMYKSRLWDGLPLEMEGELSAAYMFREQGTAGMRTVLHPVLSLPVDLKYATLIASGGLHQAFYHSTTMEGNSPLGPNYTQRADQMGHRHTVPEFNLRAYTEASRVWDLTPSFGEAEAGERRITALRHIIQPRVSYSWVPEVDQENNPFYDEEDRLLPTSEINFSLTNLFTARRNTLKAGGEAGHASFELTDPSYSEIARLSVAGGYDFREAQRHRFRDLYPRHPVLDVEVNALMQPLSWLGVESLTYFSMHGEGITRNDIDLTFSNKRWGQWKVGYSRRNGYFEYRRIMQYDNLSDIRHSFDRPLKLLTNEVNLTLTPRWAVRYYTEDDLIEHQNYQREVNLVYNNPCFRIVGSYTSEDDGEEESWRVRIELLGIGE